MNRNNNAATMQDMIQRVNNEPKMMHSIGSVTQGKDQGLPTAPAIRTTFHEPNLPPHAYNGDDRFSGATAVVPLPSASRPEFQNGSPPLFRSNPRPFSPSRSLSMPPISTARPSTFAQFNIRHTPQSSPLSPYAPFPGGNPVMPLQPSPTGTDRYRHINNNHPPHIIHRFQGSLAPCPNNNGPHYRAPGSLAAMRAPYSTAVVPGATSIGGNNPSSDKEQKETTNTRKKRKACGHCEPCRRKENCGSCMNCINRAKGKQICIHRKCEILKKKPSTSSYHSSCNPLQDKRKEIDNSLLPKQAKRSKINNSGDRSKNLNHPLLHPNFSEFGDLSQTFLSPPFNDRSVLTSGRPDFPAPSDNFPSLLTTSSSSVPFKQVANPPDSNLPAPVEEPDFLLNQTLHDIESSIQKSDQNTLSTFIDSTNNTVSQTSVKTDDTFSQFHQLQNISWSDEDLTDKLLKPLSTENGNPGQTAVGLISENSHSAKPDSLLENLSFDSKNNFQNDLTSSLTSDFSISKNLLEHDPISSSATSSITSPGIPQNDQFLVENQGKPSEKSTFQQNVVPFSNQSNSQSLNSDMSFDPTLVGQLNSPLLSPHATSMPNPSMLYNENIRSNQMMSSVQGNFNYSQISMATQAPQVGSGQNFGQYGSGQEGHYFQERNAPANDWTCPSQPMHCSSAFPVLHGDAGQLAQNNRPPDIPQANNFPTRKISSNSSDSFHFQRHLSAGSRSSNQSPMMQASPGAGSLPHNILPPGSNLKSPITGLPAGSPASSHLSGMMGSPATSVHISPTQVQTPFTSAPLAFSTAEHEFQKNGQNSWSDPHKPDPSLTPTFNYHVAHSLALTENYAQKPCTSPIHSNPVPNHFLARPGSALKSPLANVPCNENTAIHCAPTAPTECSFSSAAARLPHTQSQLKSNDTGPLLSNNQSISAAQHQVFAETMNSVLYGGAKTAKNMQSHPAKTKNELLQIKAGTVVESPTDVHSTISPGESGYDSTEPGSVASDSFSQHFVSSQGSGDVLSVSGGNTPNVLPKNLQAALTENKNQHIFSFENCHGAVAANQPVSDSSNSCWLPVKAASNQASSLHTSGTFLTAKFNSLPHSMCLNRETRSTNSLSVISTLTPSRPPVKASLRSLSVDASYSERIDCDEDGRAKQTLSLRRYSFQGLEQSQKICRNTTSSSFSRSISNAPFKDKVDKPTSYFWKSPSTTTSSTSMHTSGGTMTADSTAFSNKLLSPSGFLPQSNALATTMLTTDDLRGRTVSYEASNGSMLKKTLFPQCNCLSDGDVDDDAPYYTHLGTAPDIKGIRKLFEDRTGYTGNALRIEQVFYTGKEGKTTHGCPIAKWIIRRVSSDEKVLIVCRHRPGHHCATAYTVLIIMLWEGISGQLANETYEKCTSLIPTNGVATERRCGTNEERTCACQGFNDDEGGASFSFGCSWSMYYNGCKFARSVNPNKFKLNGSKDHDAEKSVEEFCQDLATRISTIYKQTAPEAHKNQIEHEHEGFECRLGKNPVGEGRPFSGVTCCMDFCAHSHKDQHNMDNGTTVVLTLTKPENREIGKRPADEQLHVLPLYRWEAVNEDGTLYGIGEKIKSGAVEILTGFRRAVRLRDKPQGTCKQRKERKKRAELAGGAITPKKRKGRKAKRSLSMEDVSAVGHPDVNNVKQQPHKDFNASFPQWNHPTPQFDVAPSTPSSYHPEFNPTGTPPPRWPNRRRVSPSHEPENVPSQSNLPSIGSFFGSPSRPAVGNLCGSTPPVPPIYHSSSPQQPFHFGHRLSSTSPSTHGLHFSCPASDSYAPVPPSVAAHGAYGSLTPVKSEPVGDPHTWYSEPADEKPVVLKTYARLTSQVKQESAVPQASPSHFPSPYEGTPSKNLPVHRELFSDSEESFHNPNIGGVAIAPTHGSIIIECAKRELHATTSLLKPDRFHPSRISLVFYQHKHMNYRNHGAVEYEAKEAKRSQEKAEKLRREAAKKAMEEKQAHQINPSSFCPNGLDENKFYALIRPEGYSPSHKLDGHRFNSHSNPNPPWPRYSQSVSMDGRKHINDPPGHWSSANERPGPGWTGMPVCTWSSQTQTASPPVYQSLPSEHFAYDAPRVASNSSGNLFYRPRAPAFPVCATASNVPRYRSISNMTLAQLNQRSYSGSEVVQLPLSAVSSDQTEKTTRCFTVL